MLKIVEVIMYEENEKQARGILDKLWSLVGGEALSSLFKDRKKKGEEENPYLTGD